jgi:hypothetical protein
MTKIRGNGGYFAGKMDKNEKACASVNSGGWP